MHRNKFLFGVLLMTAFGSNSQMAPVAAGNSRVLERGTGHRYEYVSTVTLNEPSGVGGKDVGYQIWAGVSVAVVWENPLDKNDKLLEFQVHAPKLLIKSRKAPTPEGFVDHSSNLENLRNSPYAARWVNGRVTALYIDTKEEKSLVDVKRGISSLFQFQLLDVPTTEIDASGQCAVTYSTVDPHTFTKTKTDCAASSDAPRSLHMDSILSGRLNSTRTSTYVLSKDFASLASVTANEKHELTVAMMREAGGSLTSHQKLTISDIRVEVNVLKSTSLGEAVKEYQRSRRIALGERSLETETESAECRGDCPSLPKVIKDNREHLSASNLGTLKSATAFHKILTVARTAKRDDLTKAFKGAKNKEILAQLCDLAGAIQTPDSHETIMKLLKFDSDEDLENAERYLWSLSVGKHPNEFILRDIYNRSQGPIRNEKLSETVTLTLASMANQYQRMMGAGNELTSDIAESILRDLASCKEDNCKYKYLRALKNLKCPKTIKTIISHALDGKKKVSVAAMRTLRAFQPKFWTDDVLDAAQRIYFQAGKKYDSSARTLALDILIESDPDRDILRELIISLTQSDKAYEVKQYLIQRVNQMSEKCPKFSAKVESILGEVKNLFNNYNVKAQRGLTTAFTRSITSSPHWNASLVSVQEMFGGFLKRGLVDVVVDTPDGTSSLFTLGLFAGGLSSFVSSSDDKSEDAPAEDEEAATAGMELDVLGTQLRPFVFFTGQGELMGHVWSGSASEKTPAYQALIVTQDYTNRVPLQNGLVSHLQLLGVVSFDLSGQVQMSLWNRNAHSLVEKNAGIFVQGRITADTSFVKSNIEFNIATEVKLNLQSNLNFYNEISLCMQLSQPDCIIKHNVHKVEKIPGSKHRLRRSKYKQTKVPGRTYSLNRKNNEMCNLIFTNN